MFINMEHLCITLAVGNVERIYFWHSSSCSNALTARLKLEQSATNVFTAAKLLLIYANLSKLLLIDRFCNGNKL